MNGLYKIDKEVKRFQNLPLEAPEPVNLNVWVIFTFERSYTAPSNKDCRKVCQKMSVIIRKRELNCQNELFSNIIKSDCFDFSDELFDVIK